MVLMSRYVVKPMNKTLAGILAGTSIATAGVLVLLFALALLLGQVEMSWDGARGVVMAILLIGFQVLLFRYFLARAR
jgi:hypothetical protein